ncbi:hypothetical protein IW248_000043 [Micromonospora ureilytica]|uniref:Uncharacterized protein n=1 Tax=Micromonospora ureilytica TaxID=709868 RepID=A0ABS0J9M6_9ACTN|nr:hypothetical protein [Micromonospora ureilytica]
MQSPLSAMLPAAQANRIEVRTNALGVRG